MHSGPLPPTYEELEIGILSLKDTASGSDGVPNGFFRHASLDYKTDLLELFNRSWNEGIIPVSWKSGVSLPFAKPGKDLHKVDSYRYITLLNTNGKLMERLVNKRLQYWLEKERKLGNYQYGFRPGRSTYDVLIQIEMYIRTAL